MSENSHNQNTALAFERARDSGKISDLEEFLLEFPNEPRAAEAREQIRRLMEESWFLPVDELPTLETWSASGLDFSLYAPQGSLGSVYYQYVLEVKKRGHQWPLLMVTLEASRIGSFLGVLKQKSHGNCGPFSISASLQQFKQRSIELAQLNLRNA